jgi:methylenetetrahydrofolate dehydrogenase (NADP+) / methenyltetrahydrofolate cyclohydrolase
MGKSMSHRISGTAILKTAKERFTRYLPSIQQELSQQKIVVFQFKVEKNRSNDPVYLAQVKAASTSTNQKQKIFQGFLGCQFEKIDLDPEINYKEFKNIISGLDNNVQGIIIQHPIPKSLDPKNDPAKQIVNLIDVEKDIDAMSIAGKEKWGRCATADAICRVVNAGLMDGCKIHVIGAKGFVGGDVANYLEAKGLSVNRIDASDKSSGKIEDIKRNDIVIIISATGAGNILGKELIKKIKPYLVVDSTFTTKQEMVNGVLTDKVVGDLEEDARLFCQFFTPVPGGIGPMEMAVLAERFLITQFPGLQIESWQLKPLYELTDEDLAQNSYLIEPMNPLPLTKEEILDDLLNGDAVLVDRSLISQGDELDLSP